MRLAILVTVPILLLACSDTDSDAADPQLNESSSMDARGHEAAASTSPRDSGRSDPSSTGDGEGEADDAALGRAVGDLAGLPEQSECCRTASRQLLPDQRQHAVPQQQP